MQVVQSKKAQELAESNGISSYVTRDGVHVIMCHYSADEDKNIDTPRGQEWLRKALSKGYTGGMAGTDWQQEMEMSFSGSASRRVWPDFVDSIQPKIVVEPFEVSEHWPIYAGYDYGSTNPFAFVVGAWESETSIYIIDVLYKAKTSLHEQVAMLKERPYFPRIQGFIGDPSIWNQTQETMTADGRPRLRSIGEMLRDDYDIFVERGRKEEGVDVAFVEYLNSVLWLNLEEPQLKIFSTCKELLRELRKARYKTWATDKTAAENNAKETLVQKENHAWDAMKYLLLWKQGENPDLLPAPEGSFDWMRQRLQMMRLAASRKLS